MIEWEKKNPTDKVWWGYEEDSIGKLLVSFDRTLVFNLWTDYPKKFNTEQKRIFDRENPYWADFFKGRA